MGRDKAGLTIPGKKATFAEHVGGCLSAAVAPQPALEVGRGLSGLETVDSWGVDDPGTGPLTAVVAGCEGLKRAGFEGDVVVLATDLPLVTIQLVRFLAAEPAAASLVPVVAGRAQPLAARWCKADLELARTLASAGERSVMALFGEGGAAERTRFVTEECWGRVASAETFLDIDDAEDLSRLKG